jgi:hypothetical protein
MQEPDSARPVQVTAQERTHPALRTLARACIAIAREAMAAGAARSVKEVRPAPRQEGTHD